MRFCCFFFLSFFYLSAKTSAYSVLTHEALIDAAWESSIRPVLIKNYPESNTQEALRRAKAFAYGGAIIPDMGYYPKGKRLFTDLVHYVRSGDFVQALLSESQTCEELAFALGVLAHYTADNYGHTYGINRCIPILFPKLKRKFGDTITYEEKPSAHKRVELSFDVLQVARGNYASEAYHKFVGFEVSEELLIKAFKKTYCIDLKCIFPDLKLATKVFRLSVNKLYPGITRAAWKHKERKIENLSDSLNRDDFLYHFNREEFEVQYGKSYHYPGFKSALLAGFINIIPKIGPFKSLSIKLPNEKAESYFENSFEISLREYKNQVYEITNIPRFNNKNLDTGQLSEAGEYCLSDYTYLCLIEKLRNEHYKKMNQKLKDNILNYYKQKLSINDDMNWLIEEISSVNAIQ